jgi:hypothetical protein
MLTIQILDVVGWTGVVVYVTAYGLLSADILKANKSAYHAMNAVGALALVAYSNAVSDVPNLVVNAIWLAIASVSIFRIVRRKK